MPRRSERPAVLCESSSRGSTGRCGVGLDTSSTVVGARFRRSTVGCACGCGVFCAGAFIVRVGGVVRIISVGRTRSLPRKGTSPWKRPFGWRVNPLEGQTIDRRAGCGRSASPVRREGRSKPIDLPYPYSAQAAGLGLVDHTRDDPERVVQSTPSQGRVERPFQGRILNAARFPGLRPGLLETAFQAEE